jgi:hypothetical protein
MFIRSFLQIGRLVQKLNWVGIQSGDLKGLPAYFLPRKKKYAEKKCSVFQYVKLRAPSQAVSRVSGLAGLYR